MDEMTHDDDNQPATRGELRAAVQQLDQKLDASVHRLAKEIVKSQADVAEIKANMATKGDVQRIMSAIESFAGKAQTYDRASAVHGQSLTELQVQVKDHEGRIKNLESDRS
ncbi:MAG: hypothetical protein HY924_13190 [Elusimicrobia bacterium]|nr:hypothetical protein [Elusimicrobiota bacterium]